MKQSEVSKIPMIIEKVENSTYKFNKIQSLIKQVCSHDSSGWDRITSPLK